YIGSSEALFRLVQRIFFWIAPPFSVVFLLGLTWRRANGTAAVATILGGFSFRFLLEWVIWPRIPALVVYQKAYQHGALVTWIFCMIEDECAMLIIFLIQKQRLNPQAYLHRSFVICLFCMIVFVACLL